MEKSASAVMAVLASVLLTVAIAFTGFAVCLVPATTQALSRSSSAFDVSDYPDETLICLAMVTRDFTVGSHDRQALVVAEAQALVEAVDEQAIRVDGAYLSQDSLDSIRDALDAYTAAENAEEQANAAAMLSAKLQQVSELYVLPADALSHLNSCYQVISTAVPICLGLCGAGVVLLVGCGILGGRRVVGSVLMASGILAIALFAGIGAWALADFDGMFAAFHGLFFEQGTWSFPWDSLLICMYPEAFWTGMAAVWGSVSVAFAVACIVVGLVARRRAHPKNIAHYE
jgi:hypothetical protein